MRIDDPNVQDLSVVAHRLEELRDGVLFVGGAVVPLLVTDPAVPWSRRSDDVDCVVEVVSRLDYARLEESLRKKGFAKVSDGPICRFAVEGVNGPKDPGQIDSTRRREKLAQCSMT